MKRERKRKMVVLTAKCDRAFVIPAEKAEDFLKKTSKKKKAKKDEEILDKIKITVVSENDD